MLSSASLLLQGSSRAVARTEAQAAGPELPRAKLSEFGRPGVPEDHLVAGGPAVQLGSLACKVPFSSEPATVFEVRLNKKRFCREKKREEHTGQANPGKTIVAIDVT